MSIYFSGNNPVPVATSRTRSARGGRWPNESTMNGAVIDTETGSYAVAVLSQVSGFCICTIVDGYQLEKTNRTQIESEPFGSVVTALTQACTTMISLRTRRKKTDQAEDVPAPTTKRANNKGFICYQEDLVFIQTSTVLEDSPALGVRSLTADIVKQASVKAAEVVRRTLLHVEIFS